MSMSPRMAELYMKAQQAEGIDTDQKKIEAINRAVEALARDIGREATVIDPPIIRKVKFTKGCPYCCKNLEFDAKFCSNCGQAILMV